MLLTTLLLGCSPDSNQVLDDDIRLDGADDTLGVDSHSTRMCATESGTVFVFWVDDRRGPNLADLWMTRSDNLGDTWFEVPTRVSHGNGVVSEPAVACSDDGVVAVWLDDRNSDIGHTNVYANALVGDGTFAEEDVLVDNDPQAFSNAQDPVIAINGDLVGVAWADDRYGAYDILFSRSADLGMSYATPSRLGSDQLGEAFSGQPALAIGPNALWVAWEDTRNGGSDIYLQGSSTGGATFQAPIETRLDRGDDPGQHLSLGPQVCATDRGGVTVWSDARNGEGDDILFNASIDGRQWAATPGTLESDNPGFNTSQAPRCISDGAAVHTVWIDERSGGADLHFRTLENGTPMGDEDVRVDRGEGPGAAVALRPQLAVGADGPVVAWLDDRLAIQNGRSQIFNNIYYNFMGADGAFQERDFRADAGPNGEAIREDLNLVVLGRTAIFAWTDDRDGTQDVYVRTLELGEDIEGPDE
ncbi:MAG: hypothetical protein AAGA48_33425 [Myxococcota bacterium]